METKKRVKAWAIINRFGDLWSHDLCYTRQDAEVRITKVCDENGWRVEDFDIKECTVVF